MFRKMKASSVAFFLWVIITCGIHILLFRHKVSLDLPVWQRLALAAAAIGIILLLHELTHAVFMKLLLRGRVRLIFAKDKMGIPMLGVLAEKRGTREQEIILRLAPFVLLTLLPDAMFFFRADIELFFFVLAIGNCAGCFYDIMDVCMLVHGEEG